MSVYMLVRVHLCMYVSWLMVGGRVPLRRSENSVDATQCFVCVRICTHTYVRTDVHTSLVRVHVHVHGLVCKALSVYLLVRVHLCMYVSWLMVGGRVPLRRSENIVDALTGVCEKRSSQRCGVGEPPHPLDSMLPSRASIGSANVCEKNAHLLVESLLSALDVSPTLKFGARG